MAVEARDADAVVLSPGDDRFRAAGAAASARRPSAMFDEVMLAVSSDETSPAVVGLCYCLAIAACMLVRDVVRARAWTATLDRWCAARPDLVAYRGTCLVHRAQMSTLRGDWAGALDEAAAARGAAAGHRPPARRPTSSASCTGSWAATPRRRTATGGPTRWGSSRSRGSRGCASPRAGPEVAARTLRRLCGEPRPAEDRAELLAAAGGRRAGRSATSGTRQSAAAVQLRGIADEPRIRRCWLGLADQAEGAVLLAEGRPDAALDRAAPGTAAVDRAGPAARLRPGARAGRPVPAGDGRRRSRRTGVRGRPGVLRAPGRGARPRRRCDGTERPVDPARAGSPTGRSRSSGWWRPATPTGPSPAGCA